VRVNFDIKKKRERKPKGQSRIDNRDTLAPPAQDVAIDKQNTKSQQRKPKRLAKNVLFSAMPFCIIHVNSK
jgi:hypothetical protein